MTVAMMLRFFPSVVLDFFLNESGMADPKKGLPLAWIAGILAGAAVLLGGAEKAPATNYYCTGIKCPNDQAHCVLIDDQGQWIACACICPPT